MMRLQKIETLEENSQNHMTERRILWPLHAMSTVLLLAVVSMPHAAAQSGLGAPVFDNERATVWDITLTPAQPVSLGHHENDFVALFFSGGRIRTTHADGKTSVASRNFGDAVYEPKGSDEKVEVISQAPARLFVVELKNDPARALMNKSGLPLAFPRPGAKKVLENDRIVVWNYTFTLGVPTPTHYHDKDALIVYRYDGSISSTTPDGQSVVSENKTGQVKFSGGDRTHFEELVKGQETVIVTEFK